MREGRFLSILFIPILTWLHMEWRVSLIPCFNYLSLLFSWGKFHIYLISHVLSDSFSTIRSSSRKVCPWRNCVSVPSPCDFFRGISLALRSHDQIPAFHWLTPQNCFKDFEGNLFQRFWRKIISKILEENCFKDFGGFSKHRPSGPMLSISRNVRPSVCLSVCLFVRPCVDF